MTRLLLLATLATLTTSTRAWPRLDEALKNYPAIHARETARLKAGDATAKFVLPRAGARRLFRRDCERVESPVNPALTACGEVPRAPSSETVHRSRLKPSRAGYPG